MRHLAGRRARGRAGSESVGRLLEQRRARAPRRGRRRGGSWARRWRARRRRRRRRRGRARRGRRARARARPSRSRSRARASPRARLRARRVDDRVRRERLEARRDGRRAEREEDLAVRRAVERHAPADPARDADEVPRVALGEVLDAGRRRDREVDRLAGLASASQRSALVRELGEVRVGHAALREAQQHRPGAQAAADALDEPLPLERRDEARGRATSAARPPSASSPTESGRGDSTTRTSSCAARSIACVPFERGQVALTMWNDGSTLLKPRRPPRRARAQVGVVDALARDLRAPRPGSGNQRIALELRRQRRVAQLLARRARPRARRTSRRASSR